MRREISALSPLYQQLSAAELGIASPNLSLIFESRARCVVRRKFAVAGATVDLDQSTLDAASTRLGRRLSYSMDWRSLQRELGTFSDEAIGEIAFRAALRTFPWVIKQAFERSGHKDSQARYLLSILRGLITAKAANGSLDREVTAAAVDSLRQLNAMGDAFGYSLRTARAALNAALPSRRVERVEQLRQCLQAANDGSANTAALRSRRPFANVWNVASSELAALAGGARLPPPVLPDLESSRDFERFEEFLLSLDESWKVWTMWLRHVMLGENSDEVPNVVWPEIERRFAASPFDIWAQTDLEVNRHFSVIVLETVERALDVESTRPQSRYVETFQVENDVISVDPSDLEEVPIRISILRESVNSMNELVAVPYSNSNARIIDRARQYIENIKDDTWDDDAILVMRGDALRKELSFQLNRDIDSDIPELTQNARRSLEQAVRNHNLLINTHENLRSLDRMLSTASDTVSSDPALTLRSLIENTDARIALDQKTRKALADAIQIKNDAFNYDISARAYVTLIIQNLLRVSFAYLWKHKKALGGAVVGAPIAVYNIGKWALANEHVIMSFYSAGSTMHALLFRVFEWLHVLPLT